MRPLDALAARLRSSGELLFALAVLSVVALLVMPLGPALLDMGLALNLALSATILVVTLFSREALRFASFPTLLLLTTLFRLALNVSSTRLVLGRGEAGRVIEAFGRVVVQGNYVVGAVVFAILTLVQLLVVAKGAERVAEVAARFTLDALPGKQMAIDADLRAGFVDAAEARRRRRALERESQLYGAMDGALKFVKGDAVAGIAIVLVNVLGGLATGALRGMPLAEAARRYALLAIGDGLVSQVPALLIAVSAAVTVTRVAGDDGGAGLGSEIVGQLTGDPRALGAVAVLLGGLALAPGLPALPFLALATGAALGARRIGRVPATARPGAVEPPPPPEELAAPARVALELGPDLLALARADGGVAIRAPLAALREEFEREIGLGLPSLALRPGPLPASGWSLLVDDLPVASGRAPRGEVLSLAAPCDLGLVGIAAEPEETGCAVSETDAERARALGAVLDPIQRALVGAAAGLRACAHLLAGIQETQALLDALEPSAPALVREATRQNPSSGAGRGAAPPARGGSEHPATPRHPGCDPRGGRSRARRAGLDRGLPAGAAPPHRVARGRRRHDGGTPGGSGRRGAPAGGARRRARRHRPRRRRDARARAGRSVRWAAAGGAGGARSTPGAPKPPGAARSRRGRPRLRPAAARAPGSSHRPAEPGRVRGPVRERGRRRLASTP